MIVQMTERDGTVQWVTNRGAHKHRGRAFDFPQKFLDKYLPEWQASNPSSVFTIMEK